MDYEKLHKDTINKLHQMVNSGKITVETACDICADFVPESEDEGIRKELISLFQDCIDGVNHRYTGSDSRRWLAWLEKQGKDNMSISEATKKKLEDNLNKALEKETPESWNEFLQEGEQKPTEEYNITGIGSKNAQGKLGEMIKNLKPVNKVLEQNPADKVEPKFKVGDIISNGISEAKIVSIDKNYYNVINDEIENDANVCNWVVYFKNQDDWKLVEQKSYWGKEDEIALSDALWCCKQAASIAKDENDMGNVWYAERWLQSLKDRVQLK